MNRNRFLSAIFSITRPKGALPEPERRRAHLLAWLLLSCLLLLGVGLAFTLVDNPPGSERRREYVTLISGLGILFGSAFLLNRSGRYRLASGITVTAAVMGPWGSLIVDHTILLGNFVPLAYVAIAVLLSSILLPLYVTIPLGLVQFTILALLPVFTNAENHISWPSLFTFVLMISILCILASFINQRDLAQIERQARQLADSEARLREQSIRDHLTGVYNRRFMEATLTRELARSERLQEPLSIILLDIDHFKVFNDTLGHSTGDLILQAVSRRLEAELRGADVVCRFGGDEFVLLLPGADLTSALTRAEQLRASVGQIEIKASSLVLDPLSISLGVAAYPMHGRSGDELLAAADSALYRAKSAGRNQAAAAEKQRSILN